MTTFNRSLTLAGGGGNSITQNVTTSDSVVVTVSVPGNYFISSISASGSASSNKSSMTAGSSNTLTFSSTGAYSVTYFASDGGKEPTFYTGQVSGTASSGSTDTTPNSFSFTDTSNVARSATQTSNTITVSGMSSGASATVSVSGGTYSKNSGSYTSSNGTATNGDTFRVRHTSSSSFSTATNTTLTIGGVSDTFTSTTLASDTTPASFSFTDVSNAARSTYFYAYVQITGINTSTTVSGSSSATYGFAVSSSTAQPSGGSFTTSNKTITNGQYLHVRVLSSSSYSTAVGATITVGGVSDTFTVTTGADTTPTYTLTAPTSINEGSAGTCSVATTNVSNGTTLYWSVSPTGDFSTTVGTVSISGGSGSFSITPTADSTTEGSETASVILWSNSARTVQVASDTFVINDTSTASGGGSTGSGSGGSSTYGLSIKSTTSSATEIFGVNVRTTNIQVYSTGVISGNGGTRVHTGLGSDVTDTSKVQVIVDAGWFSSSGTFPVTRSTANGGQVTITNNRSSNATVTSLIIRLA